MTKDTRLANTYLRFGAEKLSYPMNVHQRTWELDSK